MTKPAKDRSVEGSSEEPKSGRKNGEIMAAIDDAEGVTRFIIADISADDTWISILSSEALPLPAWR